MHCFVRWRVRANPLNSFFITIHSSLSKFYFSSQTYIRFSPNTFRFPKIHTSLQIRYTSLPIVFLSPLVHTSLQIIVSPLSPKVHTISKFYSSLPILNHLPQNTRHSIPIYFPSPNYTPLCKLISFPLHALFKFYSSLPILYPVPKLHTTTFQIKFSPNYTPLSKFYSSPPKYTSPLSKLIFLSQSAHHSAN